jgi:glycerol-3-phosphate dehydrogenase
LTLEAQDNVAPLLSVFGGKITTYRKLAEAALARLSPHLPPARGLPAGWTGKHALPGGDFPMQGFDAELERLIARYPFLPRQLARRLLRAYGTRAGMILAEAARMDDLGTDFGAGFTEAELRYLVANEWVRHAEDAVWRRSKLGLRLTPEQITAIDNAIAQMTRQEISA